MTGLPEYNYPAFNRIAGLLREKGWDIVNPTELFQGDVSRSAPEYLRQELTALATCDAIICLPGFARSAGAQAELWEAMLLGKKRFWLCDWGGNKLGLYGPSPLNAENVAYCRNAWTTMKMQIAGLDKTVK